MKAFAGKTAFITGGASGIGLALARAFLAEGMKVLLADIEEPALTAALASLSNHGPRVKGAVCDVSRRETLERAAAEAVAAFGKVHILCNNAGVSRAGLAERVALSDWGWVVGVNLMGTVHGIEIFLPHMKAHGEEGHIVNTASISGLLPSSLAGPYAATKAGIIGLSEVLADELAGSTIGVSVLCPSWVRTRMVENGRNRPARFGGAFTLADDTENAARHARFLAAAATGLDPDQVAPLVLRAIREDRLYVFTHLDRKAAVAARFARILDDFAPLEPPDGQNASACAENRGGETDDAT
jgi:NAD(P)-dependent dehydrogenase (short-subunit alcohol dehydrogenase family)